MADAILKLEGLNENLLDPVTEEKMVARWPVTEAQAVAAMARGEDPKGEERPMKDQPTLANVLLTLLDGYQAKDNKELLLVGSAMRLLRKGRKDSGACDVGTAILGLLRKAVEQNCKGQRWPEGRWPAGTLSQVAEKIEPEATE